MNFLTEQGFKLLLGKQECHVKSILLRRWMVTINLKDKDWEILGMVIKIPDSIPKWDLEDLNK